MKISLKHLLTGIFAFLSFGCSHPVPIPAEGSYFTFADKNRVARLEAYDFIAERVDPYDSTRVIVSQKLSSRFFVDLLNSRTYTTIFKLGSDELFQPGLNRICRVRFRYEGLPGVVDWLEFKNTAEEWVNPTDVKFNGKPIHRIDSNEPVKNSYLYVLQ